MNPGRLLRWLERHRSIFVAGLHVIFSAVAFYLAFAFRLDRVDPWAVRYGRFFFAGLAVLVPIRFFVFLRFDLFRGLWRYVSIQDLTNIVVAVSVGTVIFVPVAVILLARGQHYSGSVFVLDWAFCLLLLGGVRFAIRAFREAFAPMKSGRKRVIIVGAGDAGELLLREMKTHSHLSYDPVGFVDDDLRKKGVKIHGVKVVGTLEELHHIVEHESIDEVIVAMPSASGQQIMRIIDLCSGLPARVRRIPTHGDIVRLAQIRDVDVEDLLERPPVRLDADRIRATVTGSRVLVTGAGGSIGSEIVRQVAGFSPERICLLDWSENALFFLERELLDKFPDLSFVPVVADIRDRDRMQSLFAEGKFQHVYHAAAFKHVPLMEENPLEAVKNNVGGTSVLVECAQAAGVEKFVLISSDKAVRPTSIMGATKRAAEILLSTRPVDGTQFLSVRFGNVLGSQGSVVPLFRRQIAAGGPVTVTDPDVVRYFMTIPEAVQLVLQAGTMGRGGEVFLLDMGEPVRILDLARRLIELSGFQPEVDIPIRIVGLRPGEKLYEELLVEPSSSRRTQHEMIWILDGDGNGPPDASSQIQRLVKAAERGRREDAIRLLGQIVPEYRPNNEDFAAILQVPAQERAG